MFRAHALGAENPLAAFQGKPEPLEAYFDTLQNLPVATPLMRKDCSPICDGAAAVILTSRPQAVRVAGLGSATDTSSILDRVELAHLVATTRAAQLAYFRAGIRDPRELEGLVVECHDAFNSLLPINLGDLGLVDHGDAIEALVGKLRGEPGDPLEHPVTGVRGRLPTNLSGGLKARGHPVGGTGLFQIAENYLQITGRFPNAKAQVNGAKIGIAHSIGGPGNNVYVTILEAADSRRKPQPVPKPRLTFEAVDQRREAMPPSLHGSRGVVEAATSIYVTTTGTNSGPIHVALLKIDGRRVFARLENPLREGERLEELLAGETVKLLVKDDGDHYFQLQRGTGFTLTRIVQAIRRRVARSGGDSSSAGDAA
jgi:hypothetical protein